jgi:hypothetical protein
MGNPNAHYTHHTAPTQFGGCRHVICYGRFTGNGRPAAWIVADVVRFANDKLAEHWDVLQDEASCVESESGLPTFGDRLPA